MRWSELHIPTLREIPSDAEAASHRLLLRAGYIRQIGAGIYGYLFLAQRSLLKIAAIVREEMDRMGAQEMLFPALLPAELWKESGRWDEMGENLFRLKDRFDRELGLGMTHEEAATAIARRELRSYKQLPQIWYQIQTKFRDEPRPKGGLLRVRQFLMKDAYSFDIDAAGLDVSYEKHYDAYCRIFERCGLEYMVAEAQSGSMGGSHSQEFLVASDAGEDYVVVCRQSGYCANLEKAVSRPAPPLVADPDGALDPEEFHTPGRKTIAEVAEFTGLPETSQMKSLVMVADGAPYLVLVRGDHQLSEAKFAAATRALEVRPAETSEISGWFGALPGSLGPVGITRMPVLADLALRGRQNMIAGANRDDYHLRNVTPGEDFRPQWHDLRQVTAGDTEIHTGDPLEIVKAIEIGHIFKLGYKYSDPMKLRVLNEQGAEVTPIMGSYGIGMERILCAAVELYHDENGIAMPASIAPFTVVVTPVNYKGEQRAAAEDLYARCKSSGLDVLLDDRDERPGVKFKDAELIGIPFRVTVGRKLGQGMVEIMDRRSGLMFDVPVPEAIDWVKHRISQA